jgi:hypothetical protein
MEIKQFMTLDERIANDMLTRFTEEHEFKSVH